MITSKDYSKAISTRDVKLYHSYGISPDTRGMPPAQRLSQYAMDTPTYFELWREVSELHHLETLGSPVPFTPHWPPGQRVYQPSNRDRRHRYRT